MKCGLFWKEINLKVSSLLFLPVTFTVFTVLILIRLILLVLVLIILIDKVTRHYRSKILSTVGTNATAVLSGTTVSDRTAARSKLPIRVVSHEHGAFHFGVCRGLRWVVCQVLDHGGSHGPHALGGASAIHGSLRLSDSLTSRLQAFLVHVERL